MSSRENESRENNQNRNKEGVSTKNFLTGAVIGGVVGAAAALLFAPKAGKEIRSNLNNQVTNLFDKTTQLSDEVIEKSNGLAAITKEKTTSLSKAVVQQSKELVNKAKGLSTTTVEQQGESETNYIPINDSINKPNDTKRGSQIPTGKDTDIRKKLEEAQRAFDEEENKIKK
ncbi:YtxH domain-containing protein [Bacillus sp. EB600]|uniref:YtxH domain-containing protein n=1 Tax=Bacillus sp. EB600 TaxID=2806345 RepID=UPI00210A3358|nr:YtxH domain-containing protein [Bacillus sp. EB600]MCQ6278397.1 YtxH domain-containing protein [Bacillus sp. EB600]